MYGRHSVAINHPIRTSIISNGSLTLGGSEDQRNSIILEMTSTSELLGLIQEEVPLNNNIDNVLKRPMSSFAENEEKEQTMSSQSSPWISRSKCNSVIELKPRNKIEAIESAPSDAADEDLVINDTYETKLLNDILSDKIDDDNWLPANVSLQPVQERTSSAEFSHCSDASSFIENEAETES